MTIISAKKLKNRHLKNQKPKFCPFLNPKLKILTLKNQNVDEFLIKTENFDLNNQNYDQNIDLKTRFFEKLFYKKKLTIYTCTTKNRNADQKIGLIITIISCNLNVLSDFEQKIMTIS